MFLHLKHTKLDVYEVTRKLLVACYKVVQKFPPGEQFNLTFQVKKAALSVLLNYSEGASRTSARERKRFFEVARSSSAEIDTAFDAAFDLKYVTIEDLAEAGTLLVRVFQMLSRLIQRNDKGNDSSLPETPDD